MNNNRITLQYSVEESQLKFEVHRLVCNALRRLTSITSDEPAANSILSMSTVDEIRALRLELAKIDVLFADVGTIIENYVDYKHEQRVSQSPVADEVPSEPLNLDVLQDRIQNFKENLKLHENTD